MRLLATLFVLLCGTAAASPSYHVQMQLGIGTAQPAPVSMVVFEGKTASISVSGEHGYKLELTVTPAAKNAKSGAEQVQVKARVLGDNAGKESVLGEPSLTVELGRTASIGVRADDAAAGADAYYLELTVDRGTRDLAMLQRSGKN